MKKKTQSASAKCLIACILVSGCASFRPGFDRQALLDGTRIPTAEQTIEGVTLSIEEFATAAKSKLAFDSDVASSGVIPLLIRIENKTSSDLRIPAEAVKAYIGDQLLSRLTGEKAAREAATRDYVGKALGWTVLAGPFAIVAWPGTIVGSAVHTRNVNSRIIQHFRILEFTGSIARANQSVGGFVYYQIPADTKLLQNIAETKAIHDLRVELIATGELEAQSLRFNVPLPLLKLSPPPS
jgi:hypothetical protein